MKILHKPLWHFLCILAVILRVIIAIIFTILWYAFSLDNIVLILGISTGIFIGFYLVAVQFLYYRFFNVKPSASFAFKHDIEPWLSWREDPKTTITITWCTKNISETKIAYGLSEITMAVIEGKPGLLHRITISNLQPGMKYIYRIEGNPLFSKTYTFQTAPSPSNSQEKIRFIVFGDTQNGGGWKTDNWGYPALLQASKQHAYDLIMNLGDFCDQGNDLNSWYVTLSETAKIASEKPLHVAVGNHDTGTNYMNDPEAKKVYPDDGANFDYFFGYRYAHYDEEDEITPFRSKYYSFSYGNCLFLFLDTQNSKMAEPLNPQWRWLEQQLANAAPNLWKIAFIHRDLVGIRQSPNESPNYDYDKFAQYFLPIFAKYGVDIVFQGHEHVYTCFQGVISGEKPYFPTENSGEKTKPITFITAGGGGDELRNNAPIDYRSQGLASVEHYEDSSHFLLVEVALTDLKITAHDVSNRVFHTVLLSKNER
jgi:hypothetical protein